jgi:hypothetical protein
MTKGGKKLIKVWVNKENGEIEDVKLGKDDGSDEKDANKNTATQPPSDYELKGTIYFYKQNNPGNCIVIEAGGYFWEICW